MWAKVKFTQISGNEGRERYRSLTPALDGVNGQRHASAALPPRVSIVQEAGLLPNPFWKGTEISPPPAIRLPYSPSRSELPYWLSHPRILKYVVHEVTSIFWKSGATFYNLMDQVRVTCTSLSSQIFYVSVTTFLGEMFFNQEDERNICFRNFGACYVTRRDNPEYLRLTLTRTVTRFSNVTHTNISVINTFTFRLLFK